MLSAEEIAVYVRAYQQPGAVRGSRMDYRAAPQDVGQDREDADRLIDCPVLTMWGEDFSAVGQAYDVLDVRGWPATSAVCPFPSADTSARRNAPTWSTRNSSASWRTGTAEDWNG